MLSQGMQHMIQEANARAHGDLLGRGELRGMPGVGGRDEAMFGGF